MTTQRLEDGGSFVPENVRGKEPEASLSAPVTVAFGVASIVACVLVVIGDGGGLSWIGAGAFCFLLWLFAFLADRAIDRQSDRVDEWLDKAGEGGEEDEGDEGGEGDEEE